VGEHKGAGMALTVKSGDEITSGLADIYDELLLESTDRPLKVWRNNNNKLYLVFKALAEGFKLILDTCIALRDRFNPALCDDTDLHAIAKLVGTEIKKGAGSVLEITVTNDSVAEQKTLSSGEYRYISASGMVFIFNWVNDTLFNPGEQKTVFALSKDIGSYHVDAAGDLSVSRTDGGRIDSFFSFSCIDNSGSLGYLDEDSVSFRQRVLNDVDRQDHIKEMELKIRNLPSILECSLVFNQNNHSVTYDDIELAPMELLVVITGSPTDEIAEIVASHVIYQTHLVDQEQVVYYRNSCYVDGKYPVYFMFHKGVDFSLAITYRYDSRYQQEALVKDAVNTALTKIKSASAYTGIINEEMIYNILSDLNLPGTRFLNVDILVDGEPVAYLDIPKTRLPNLTGCAFTAIETGEVL
jgi:hypothetical protein